MPERGEIDINDRPRHAVAVLQHAEPDILVNEVIHLKCGFQYLTGRAGPGLAPPLVLEQLLEHLPPQLKLNHKFVDDPADDKLVFQVLLVRL